ncbi:hypothetical protein Gotur_000038, partial [Gossypium turneri]
VSSPYYRILKSNFHTSSNDEDYKGFYTDLWALNIPEKIKIHVWRMFNNLVPYYVNLVHRTLCEETVCPLCKVELENSEHLLWSCGVLQGVWASMQVQIPPFEDSLDYKNHFVKTFLKADGKKKNDSLLSLYGAFGFIEINWFTKGLSFRCQNYWGLLEVMNKIFI